MSLRPYLIGGGAALGLLLVWRTANHVLGSREAVTAPTRLTDSSSGSADGVGPRASDPAGFLQPEWSDDPQKVARYRERVDEAPDIVTLLREQGRQWARTRLALEDPFREWEGANQECRKLVGAVVEQDGEVCGFALAVVVEPSGAGMGQVRYSRAELDDGEDPACQPLAGCVANKAHGMEVPLPEGSQGIALVQRIKMRPTPPYMRDPAHLSEVAEVMTEDLARARVLGMAETDDPELYYRFIEQERIVEFLGMRVEKLRERDHPQE